MLLARSQELESRTHNFDFEIVFFPLTDEIMLPFSPVLRKVRSPPNFSSLELVHPAIEVLRLAAQEQPLHPIALPHLLTAPFTSVPGSHLPASVSFSADHPKAHEPPHGHLFLKGIIPNSCL